MNVVNEAVLKENPLYCEECYHCGLPNPQPSPYKAFVFDEERTLCCPGCEAITNAIVDNGLTDYYKFRTETATQSPSEEEQAALLAQLALFDEPELQAEFVHQKGELSEVQLTIEGITCAACGWLIERHLSKIGGIKQSAVNVASARATIKWDNTHISLSQVLQQFKSIGYIAKPFTPENFEKDYQTTHKRFIKQLGLAGIMTMQVMMLSFGFYFDLLGNIDDTMEAYFHWVSLVLTTPVVFYSGSTFYLGAIRALLARGLSMDIPVSLAILGTYFAGIKATIIGSGDIYFESICMFIFFLLTSRFLEHRARYRATEIASNTMQYIPVSATVLNADSSTTLTLARKCEIGQIVLVKPGDTIPIDGVIIEGESHIEESMLTGEFIPVFKKTGDPVFGGTVNQEQPIQVRVTSQLNDALVNQILKLQEQAISHKPKIAQMADRLSQYFVSAVLVISVSTYAIWSALDNPDAFWITVCILIATCPCALGLATPSALTSAMARLQKVGILLKRADTLERITDIEHILFDKTGTLTAGEFTVSHAVYASDCDAAQCDSIVASLEHYSEHPIANAFSHYPRHPAQNVINKVNQGIQGNVDNHTYFVGNAKLIPHAIPEEWNTATVFLANNDVVMAAYWLNDVIKPHTQETLALLSHYSMTILSGDSSENVHQLATQLHVNNFYSQMSPEDKLNFVSTMQKNNEVVMMLGDGINDAPVLAQADVSVTVGNATDFAKHATDVIMLQDHLQQLPLLLKLSHKTKRIIKQNFMWSIGYNLLVLPFAIMGLLTPWQAALGMSLSSLIVVYNSARLLKFKVTSD